MIEAIRARNYGCLVDVEAELTPLHAFIGPNDSGKSTLLHALRTVVQFAGSKFEQDKDGGWKPFDPFISMGYRVTGNTPKPLDMLLECRVHGGSYALITEQQGLVAHMKPDGVMPRSEVRTLESWTTTVEDGLMGQEPYEQLLVQLLGARLIRFDPDALRHSSGLIPEAQSIGFLDDRGHGLAGVYFAIRNRNDDAFATIVEGVRQHFPTIRGLRVKAMTSSEVALEVELVSGARVGAKRMSEGLLYYLAFAALRHLDPVSLLLVEEPENGLHPARIAEVVRILRAVVKETGTQVVMATHSPLVVNELRPEEVSVVTRKPKEGTQVKRIKDTPDFEERAKIYALGELWIAYANGEDEAPLLEGKEP